SFIIDNLLRSSESSNLEYRTSRDVAVEDLESVKFIDDAYERGGGARDDAMEEQEGGAGSGAGASLRAGSVDDAEGNKQRLHASVFQLSDEWPQWFLNSKFKKAFPEGDGVARTPVEIERMVSEAIQAYADPAKPPSAERKAFLVSFILSVGSETSSTTSVSIAIRGSAGGPHQLVLEYSSERHMRDMVWGPEGNKKQPGSEVVDALRCSMGWSGDDSDSAFDAEARKFLKDQADGKEPSLESMPELAAVLGRKVAVAGRGRNRLLDRLLMRGIVHTAQGIPDGCLGTRVEEEGGVPRGRAGGPVFEVLCSFDREEQLRVGKATCSALARITLFLSCGLAPCQDSEFVDTAGCNDPKERQRAALQAELKAAKQLVVVVEKSLQNSEVLSQHLRESSLPARIAGVPQADAPIRSDNSMMLIHNRERIRPLLSQEGFDADEKNVKVRQQFSRNQVRDNILEEHLENEDEARKKVVLDRIPMLHPAVSLCTSLIFGVGAHGESEEARQKLLDSMGGYELLGWLEQFQQACVRARVDTLLDALDGPDGLCEALEEVKRSQVSVATAVGRKELVAAWRGQELELGAMRASFEECLNEVADHFSNTFQEEVGRGVVMAEVQRAFDGRCSNISKRRNVNARAVSYVDTYFTKLQDKLKALLASHVESLQKLLRSEFQPVVKREMVSFVVKQISSLNLPGDNSERIEALKKKATLDVGGRFDTGKGFSTGFHKVVGDFFLRTFNEVFTALKERLQKHANALDEARRKEFFSKEQFAARLPEIVEAAARVVDLVRMSLTCRGGVTGEVFSTLMGQLDIAPVVGRGSVSRVKILRDLSRWAEKLLFVLNEERASWSERDEERLQDLTTFRGTLADVVRVWGTSTAPRDIGKEIFEDCVRKRLMDKYNVLHLRSASAPLLDETPSQATGFGKHNIFKGHLPFVGSNIQGASDVVVALWKTATRTDPAEIGIVTKLDEALDTCNKGKLVFLGSNGDDVAPQPDDLLSSYLIVALDYAPEEARRPETLRRLREQILCEAARRKEYASVLRETHGGLEAFKAFILDTRNLPDVVALCLLAEIFERRLNLYVPWKTLVSTDEAVGLPLRIRPRQLVDSPGKEGHTNADAVVLWGAAGGGHLMGMCTTVDRLYLLKPLGNAE
ncbi:hypothetical protein T484DRAFT_1826321, partial [Baffinella frigidus]